jgi:putative chitinase
MALTITPEQLHAIAGAQVNATVAEGVSLYLPPAMEKYEINTPLRVAHFLAQCAHESDHFRTLHEYASGREYEGRRDLGNVKPGDGPRFRGAGLIQLTGRSNYDTYGRMIGVDLINNPELALQARYSCLLSCAFWYKNGLNALADKDDVKSITHRVNGGYNGLADRQAMLARAKKVAPAILG